MFLHVVLMKRSILVKAVRNKKNGQITISLPKKKLSNSLKSKLMGMGNPQFKIKIEELI